MRLEAKDLISRKHMLTFVHPLTSPLALFGGS